MPVTKSAKRALRGSREKEKVNKIIKTNLDIAIRVAKKSKLAEKILKAISLADRAVKKRVLHKNKAARIKSTLSKLLPKTKISAKEKSPKKKK